MHIMMTANAAWNVSNFRGALVEALLGEGHRITVLAPHDAAVTALERLGCRFLPLEMSVDSLNPIEGLRLRRRFSRIFREERPDIILSFTIKNNIFGARAARALGIPFVPNVTGLGTAFLSGKLLQIVSEQLYRTSFNTLPVVFFQNEDDRDLFVGRSIIRIDQTRLLPGSGIDLRRFAPTAMPPDGEAMVFLMVARLLRDKGIWEFVGAARRIKAKHPQARFQLLGSADSKNRSAVESATLEGWINEGVVEYLGTTSDVRPAIAAASCVVLPSYREGAPRTLIEASAMGRPIITTNVPGCRAVVDHGVSGFLCDVRSVSSLAGAIERFLALSPASRNDMGRAGRAKMVREYDQSIVIQAYRDAMARLATEKTA